MSKKKCGLTALTNTMIKQHGLDKAIIIAHGQVHALKGTNLEDIWRYVLIRLKMAREMSKYP